MTTDLKSWEFFNVVLTKFKNKIHLIKLGTDFSLQPSWLLGERAPLWEPTPRGDLEVAQLGWVTALCKY